MNSQNQFTKIHTDESFMETVQHGSEAFPFHYYYEDMSLFDFNCVDWHWHAELEFVYIETGSVSFDIGTDHFDLSAGCAILINSRVLHRMQSDGEALIPNFLFLPSFIAPENGLIYRKFVAPFIDSSSEYAIFSPENPQQADILETAAEVIRTQTLDQNELRTSMLLQKLWLLIFENGEYTPSENSISTLPRARLQIMMQYIHENYSKHLTLEDIAESAKIGNSTALNLFRNYLKETPVNYLIGYRLKQASLQLVKSEKKVAAIAYDTGFHSVDHFCRSFKRLYGKTPTQYRTDSQMR